MPGIGRHCASFLRWCEGRGISELGRVQPVQVADYIELLQGKRSAPTVRQHLACIRMLFDWLVIGQVMPTNPAHSVRGPRHSVTKGVTPVLSSEEAAALFTGMDVSTVVGLRERATRPDAPEMRVSLALEIQNGTAGIRPDALEKRVSLDWL